jgi:hypothetical protein
MTSVSRQIIATVVLTVATVFSGTANADVVWEDIFTDEQTITNNLVVAAGGTSLSFETTVFSDSTGGTFDLAPVRSASHFSFEESTTGNHAGYIELTFDNENDDPDDFLELSINFGNPVVNLSFDLLDVDGENNFAWDDGVEVFFNGINTKTDSNLYSIGPILFLDNETYMDGFEAGNASAASTQDVGNIGFDFGDEPIETITIRYFSTDDAIANPASQFIGISDLQFTAIPEPSLISAMVLGAMLGLTRRRRTS